MDNSKPQASSSASIIESAIEEALPPEWEQIREMMPPDLTPTEMDALLESVRKKSLLPDVQAKPSPQRYADPWPASIDRILAAVYPKLVPQNLNRAELNWALQRDITNYRDLDEFRSGHLWKNKVAELKDLQRLLSLARSGDWPIPPDIAAILSVEKWCRSMLPEVDQGWHPERWHPDFEGKSLIALLIGHILPKTFERHFGRQAATTPTGPYVRFVMAVLKEFDIKKSNGEDYKRWTIVSELNAVRTGHVRRNGRRVPQTTKPAEDIATFVPPQVPHRAPPY
jgi:hypothetical protein